MKVPSTRVSAMKIPLIILLVSIFILLFISSYSIACSTNTPPEKINVIMVGDRLINVAYHLGVLPEALVFRASLYSNSEEITSVSRFLGCPNSVLTKKKTIIADTAKELGINKIIIEKSKPFCFYKKNIQFENIEKQLSGKGLSIEYVDFNDGIKAAVQRMGHLLGKETKAKKLLEDYAAAMEQMKKVLPREKSNKKIVVISGTLQAKTKKVFLRVEAPGGYTDQFLLEPLGLINAGNLLYPEKAKPQKGYVGVRKIDGLIKAAPDAIIITGNSLGVQMKIRDELRRNPALRDVPAIKNIALYSLPIYYDSRVLDYPQILMQWNAVLLKKM